MAAVLQATDEAVGLVKAATRRTVAGLDPTSTDDPLGASVHRQLARQFCEKYNFCPTHLSNVKNGKAPLTKVMAARYGLAIHQEQQAQKNR